MSKLKPGLTGGADLTGYTALYGGSFDPPHVGHQMACLYLLDTLQARDVWLLPANNHPLGKHLSAFEHRRAMCDLLAAPFHGRVLVDDVERRLGGAGRTLDTVEHLLDAHPQNRFVLAIGADILTERDAWHRFDQIERLLPIIVIGRPGFPSTAPIDLPAVASRDLRDRLRRGGNTRGLIPAKVREYVDTMGVYGDDPPHGRRDPDPR